MAIVRKYLRDIGIGEVNTFKNMTTVELHGINFPKPEYISLKEAIEEDKIEISEIDESGNVPILFCANKGDLPILLYDGEELKGAKQNRVLNTSILVPENSKIEIPVSCTEQGRWSYNSPKFRESGNIASPRLRRNKNISVTNNLKVNSNYRSNQSKVWEDIGIMECKSEIRSETSALEDIFKGKKENLSEYLSHFKTNKHNGILVFINNKIAGMELLSNELGYKKYHDKIIKSYALDASINYENDLKEIDYKKEAKNFIAKTTLKKPLKKDSVGYGKDLRFENEHLAGSILVYHDTVIHTVFFNRINDSEDDDSHRKSNENEYRDNVQSFSQRRDNVIY